MEPRAELENERELPVWLEEVDEGPKVTMEFPKGDPARRDNHIAELSKPPMEREQVTARVEYLFPRTETDWTVGRGGHEPPRGPGRLTGLGRRPFGRGPAGSRRELLEQVLVYLEETAQVVYVFGEIGHFDHGR